MEPKNSREEERSLLRKHTPGGVEHDQSTHGRWSKDVFDEEVEDVIIDQNGRVLDYPYPIGKNMERERETRRRHLRKHGSSHDEKSHGNWATRAGGKVLDRLEPSIQREFSASRSKSKGSMSGKKSKSGKKLLSVKDFNRGLTDIEAANMEKDPNRPGLSYLSRKGEKLQDKFTAEYDIDPTDMGRGIGKHGSSHDEKSHGNWARGGSGGMASSKKEVRDTNLHASKLRMQQRNKEKVEILDANMNASRMRMGARVGHRKMKAAMDAKGATQSVAPRNNDEAWGMMKALGEENRGSRNAFDPLNAYRGVRREFPKVKIVAISSDSSRPRASGKYRDQNLPRNEAEGAKRWNAKTFRFVSDGPEFEVEW